MWRWLKITLFVTCVKSKACGYILYPNVMVCLEMMDGLRLVLCDVPDRIKLVALKMRRF